MGLVQFAESELKRISGPGEDEMSKAMNKHILHMVKEFADEGHSGFSAGYALSVLKKLLAYKPLTPLTGEDDEWGEVAEEDGKPLFQNKRYSAVFKVGKDGQAYDINGKVFWEWYTTEDGESRKSYFTNYNSRVPVTFPYEVPEHPRYVYSPPEVENESDNS